MKVYDKAISLIKIRPHFSAELARKLTMRGFNGEDIEEVINRLTEEGLLNDAKSVEVFLASLIKYKTFGFYGLKAKLMQRGVDGGEAEALLKENLPFEAELEIAKKVLDKSSKLPKQKIAQRLSTKGFRSDVIRTLLQDFC